LVTQQPAQQQGSTNSNHSTSRKAQNVVHKAAVAPTALKNTVNNLLQGFSSGNYAQQEQQQPMENVKVMKSASSSRKRHLNQAEPVSKKLNNESIVDSNNFALAYAIQQQQQQNGRGTQPDLNEMVSMMLSASSAVAAQQQRHNQRHVNTTQIKHNNSASTKNQTYNQLLLLHHNQKLQQQQQLMQKQHDSRGVYLQEELFKCASPIATEQLNALQANASNLIYQQQQQQANFSNQANGNSGDNMPLKLRFKMLQLKTGEVN